LRYTLNLAERYSFSTDAKSLTAMSGAERNGQFESWIANEAERVYRAYTPGLSKADWKVFDILLKDKSGSCSPSEFGDFGYTAMPPLLARIHKLESVNLVTYTVDNADQRRRTISVTDHGRLAYYRHLTS
jgi:DNA-binding MarR family transcriptional regulator